MARRRGYPARSVYKLEEIQSRFKLIGRGDRVLDVGATPGSWSLYLLRECGARVVAVDIAPLGGTVRADNLLFIRGDVFDDEVADRIRAAGPYNAVLSDAAPSTTGSRTVDCARSYALVERVLELAPELLEPGGTVVAKVFQGGGERELLATIRSSFETARAFKPRASRKASFEIYLIGTGFVQKST